MNREMEVRSCQRREKGRGEVKIDFSDDYANEAAQTGCEVSRPHNVLLSLLPCLFFRTEKGFGEHKLGFPVTIKAGRGAGACLTRP